MDKYNDVTLEMFPDGFRDIAELVGVSLACEMCRVAGGQLVYIPMHDRVMRPLMYQAIIKDYHGGSSYEALGKAYNLSVDTVRRIVRESIMSRGKSVEDFIRELGGE